jgi:hypothetical protein
MRHALVPHPLSSCDAVRSLEVEVIREADRLALRYILTGDVARLAIPAPLPPARGEGLWNHTCFEVFVAFEGDGYGEFNFAPSTAWAAYRFDNYRQGMAPLEGIAPPRIETATTADTLEVRVALAPPVAGPLRLGLTAVIEEAGGRLSYWALGHPAERPDFHHAGGFALEV